MQPDSFAQAPFHAVAFDRSTQNASHGEAHPKSLFVRTSQKKNCHMGGKMTPALFIDALKIGVPEQARTPWKAGPLAGAGQLGTAIRSGCAHNS